MTHCLAFALPLLAAGVLLASNDLTPGMNRFACDTYRQLAPSAGNLALSPFSISMALSMLLDGARGRTAAAIAAALHQPPRPGYHAALTSLAAGLAQSATTGRNELSIANGLWVRRGFPLAPDFEKTIRTLYQAPVTPLDFSANPEQARAAINSWTAEHTKDKIRDLFAPGSINPGTRVVLTSAIYFYGKWQAPFKPAETRQEPFRLAAGGSEPMPFMHQKAEFLYAQRPALQILEMRYAGTPLAFDILLPETVDGLPALERSVDAKELSVWFAGLAPETVEVAIPKFRAESSFSLREALSRLGMADAFSTAADFSGIDGRRDLYVSDAVHKAFVDVSEEGVEAAAATGLALRALAMRPYRQIVFRADHPFAFFIRDTASGAILFSGRLVRPRS